MRLVAVFALAASSVSCRSTPAMVFDASSLRNQRAPELVSFGTQAVRCADLDGDGQPEFAISRFTIEAIGDLAQCVELVDFGARVLADAELVGTCVVGSSR